MVISFLVMPPPTAQCRDVRLTYSAQIPRIDAAILAFTNGTFAQKKPGLYSDPLCRPALALVLQFPAAPVLIVPGLNRSNHHHNRAYIGKTMTRRF